jgi:integrase
MSSTGYKRVYTRHGAFFFVDRQGKWHRLCAIADGEPAMLRALAKFKDAPAARPGSWGALIADWKRERLAGYEACTQRDYGLMLTKIEAAFRDIDVAELDAGHVMDLRDQWKDKPRSANKYQALLSVLCTYAIEKRILKANPCRDVRKLDERPRRVYQTHEVTAKVMEAAVAGRRHSGTGKAWKNANGEMYAALFAMAYLTAARAKDVRLLRWSDIRKTEILLEPTKTRKSSAAKIAVQITPAIQEVLDRAKSLGKVKSPVYVFHTLKGTPLSASAVKSAWRRARSRAGVADAWMRDLRPKALSDAKRAGLSLQQLADAAGHVSVTTTEGYLRGFEVKEADLGLALPKKVSNSPE